MLQATSEQGGTPGALPSDGAATPNVPEDNEAILEVLKKDLNRLKQQKSRPTGGVEGQTLLNLCFLNDEQWANFKERTLSLEPRDANKLYLTFNLIQPRFSKLLGRMSAFNAPFKARPNRKDPQAIEEAEIVDRMTVALDEKLDDVSRLRETLFWMGLGGTAFRLVTWCPNSTIEPMPQFQGQELLFKDLSDPSGATIIPQSLMESECSGGGRAPEEFEIYEEIEQVGEVADEVLGPFNVFVDQTVRSIADVPPDGWVHVARIKTTGWIKENYQIDVEAQKDISLVLSKINPLGEAAGGVFLRDLVPLIQGSQDENDPKMVLHVESYQPSSSAHPHGRYVCWIPPGGGGDGKVLHDAENPYEEIPLVDLHWSPVTTSFWTKAYITPLIAPQRFINKRMSQLGEQANASIYGATLLGPGLTEADIPADFPGVIKNGLTDGGAPNVGRLPPPEMPAWFLQSIEMAVKMFNDAAGGADLMEDNKFPGQLRGPMAVPMLQEIMDTQWGPLFAHLGERLARVKQMRLNRVKQFYPPVRTMHYTDKDQKDEVMTFHTEKVLRAGTNFTITVERGAILPELRALREARVSERLSGPLSILYLDERTGRLDKSKIAADLQFGDTGREGREAKYRKLAREINKLLWEGKEVPPVQPFYDHDGMADELEAEMATTEFLRASPKIQAAFAMRWQQHAGFLQQEAANQQQASQSHMIQSAVAQATQQAAAEAAAMAVKEAMAQVHSQQDLQAGGQTDQYVASAQAKTGGSAPQSGGSSPRKRKITIEEHSGAPSGAGGSSNGPTQR